MPLKFLAFLRLHKFYTETRQRR